MREYSHDLLSVIVPVYNVYNYIESSLSSILNQSYNNIEIILIDDGSTDGSGEICDKFKADFNNIKVIHQDNQGVSAARNKGIENSCGQLVAFVDADDILDPQMYEILIKNLIDTGADVSSCSYVKEYKTSNIQFQRYDNSSTVLTFSGNSIFDNIVGSDNSIEGYIWNKVWRRKAIGTIRFRTDLSMDEDCVFTWNVMHDVDQVCYCYFPMYHYLIRNSGAIHKSNTTAMSGALTAYEYMLKDKDILNQNSIDNLSSQYLQWNVIIFNSLVNDANPDMRLFERLKGNSIKYRQYDDMLPFQHRIVAKAMRGGTGKQEEYHFL